MASATSAIAATALLCSTLIHIVHANAFLKAHHSHRVERLNEADIQTTLLAEVEGTFGEGSASSRLKQLEANLVPIYAALPKNDRGYLGHAAVRYALHRLFVQRHGWVIKGLDTAGGSRNSTSGAGLLKEQVPAYLQDLFEQRLQGRGFGLHELAVLASTIEHLIHSEAIKRVGDAFKVHAYLPTSVMDSQGADAVLDTYMMSYILGEDLNQMTLQDAQLNEAEMPELYSGWADTRKFVRSVRQTITESESSAEQKSSGDLDFSLVARVAERVSEGFGTFQNRDCQQVKSSLVNKEVPGTGRVRLSDFYKIPSGNSSDALTFQESVPYLRELGALDESDADKPHVIIANYMTSPANCIASSSFYSVCCIDECEGLLGKLERQITAPDAPPSKIAALVAELSSSSVPAPQMLSASLLDRLQEIAKRHGGRVELHGRLFAQWMHHAFPQECPYPHLAGATNPQTPDEWLESTGRESQATEEEIMAHIGDETEPLHSLESLPWSTEEELLIVRPPRTSGSALIGSWHTISISIVLQGIMAAVAYGFVNRGMAAPSKGILKAEKHMV